MPGKGKRKDNPGKMDRVNPPLKTRIPVTDHPKAQHNTPKPSPRQPITTDHIMHDTSDTDSDTDTEDPVTPVNPVTAAALLFARQIVIHGGKGYASPSTKRAIWCLRELLAFIKGDVESVFSDKVFAELAQIFANSLDQGGAAWVNSTSPIPPTTTESSTQTTPPPQSPP
ncbi:hypothetical protein L211DRAFT_195910 [Terfezia boudieri ATCC MYA-4762]|uniref:Uncharacterized protein n=1 Tax=Terfezia boudieri ATCC MYA-4762 TaxID=1051890 RepID=A0A3N4M257_9PEZI|nr:hypothetical protein L211DRAFT_195910 [Terfezia boudieri ATCC MYA-4762]